jgi:DNA-binding transcriptional regulator YbjK
VCRLARIDFIILRERNQFVMDINAGLGVRNRSLESRRDPSQVILATSYSHLLALPDKAMQMNRRKLQKR